MKPLLKTEKRSKKTETPEDRWTRLTRPGRKSVRDDKKDQSGAMVDMADGEHSMATCPSRGKEK